MTEEEKIIICWGTIPVNRLPTNCGEPFKSNWRRKEIRPAQKINWLRRERIEVGQL
jgi:hypothetical protein